MNADETTPTDSPQPRNRCAIWPWAVSAIVLMLVALGFSFWCRTTDQADWLILIQCKSLQKLTYSEDCSFRDALGQFKKARPDVEVIQR